MISRSTVSLFIIGLASICSISANAGLVTQYTSVHTYKRACPGLQDPNYVNKWQGIVELFYGMQPGEASAEIMCHFNGGNQSRIYNFDGTVKADSPWPHMPVGSPFTIQEAGHVDITPVTGTDQVTYNTPQDRHFANVILDQANLGLPQIKVKSESSAFERNSVNGFAATEYLWTGAAQTLSYTMNFDFFTSGGMWNLPGAANTHDYIFTMEFGAAVGMQLDPSQPFALDYGTILTSDSFSSAREPLISGSQSAPYTGSMTVSFDVNTGDQFFLYGQAQAFGLNGGYTDASHTVTTALVVQGQTQEHSNQLFATALQPAPPSPAAQIPEPSSILLMLLGLGGLLSRRNQ